MAIIGNRFLWDPTTGGLVGSKGQFVNTLNKELSMKEFFNEPHSNNNFDKEDGRDGADSPLDVHRPRPNVVLLGDSLGDARMTLNLEFVANVVKVRRAKKQCGEKNRDGSAHSRYPFKTWVATGGVGCPMLSLCGGGSEGVQGWRILCYGGFRSGVGGATLATIPAPSATLIVLYLTEPYNNIQHWWR